MPLGLGDILSLITHTTNQLKGLDFNISSSLITWFSNMPSWRLSLAVTSSSWFSQVTVSYIAPDLVQFKMVEPASSRRIGTTILDHMRLIALEEQSLHPEEDSPVSPHFMHLDLDPKNHAVFINACTEACGTLMHCYKT